MFKHSIKVPRLYKVSAKILYEVKEQGGSLKELVFKQKHINIKGIYAIVVATLQRFSEVESIITKSELLIKEPRFDPWLARILITELLWGKKHLPGESTPLKTILSYRQVLEQYKSDVDFDPEYEEPKKVEKPRFVRVNTLSITLEDAINGFRDEGWNLIRFSANNYNEFLDKISSLNEDEFMIDVHIKELLIFPSNATFYKHEAYKMGSILLQDKASCLPSHLLNPPPGSGVLDMCAAPGMKTTHLAALMNNKGTIYAVEMNERRFNTLNEVTGKIQQSCIKTINKDVLQVTARDCPNVEYILVDPSCSGSGMTSRVQINGKNEEPDLSRLEKLSGFQILILKHALLHFPQAKRVVYSTCSIYSQENEYVVEEVLKSVGEHFELVSAKDLLNGPWKSSSTAENSNSIVEKCLYMKPEDDLTNGFFVAVFERIKLQNNEVSEKQLRTKKKAKSNEFEETTENLVSENKSMSHEEEENETKFKKKKRHHVSSEKDNSNIKVEELNEEFRDNVTGTKHVSEKNSKSSKKSRKKNLTEECVSANNEDETSAEIVTSKKKHKKKAKEEVIELKCDSNDEKMKKKKKKRMVDVENGQNKTNSDQNVNEIPKKRKKEDVRTVEAEEENMLKVKRKKKTKIKAEILSADHKDSILDNKLDIIKKKKKKSSS